MSHSAAAIRAARAQAGLTQAELARRAKITQSAISRIEAGERSPGGNVLYAIARALGVTVDSLLTPQRRRPRAA